MKSRVAILTAAIVFAAASVSIAQTTQQQPRPDDRTAPQAQPGPDSPEIQTRTAAPTNRQGELPSTTTYTNPPAPVVQAEPVAPAVEVAVPEPPAPAPVVAETETTTTGTEFEELPGSASPFPSVGLAGLALVAAGVLIRRKR
jgi:hypothetical protein